MSVYSDFFLNTSPAVGEYDCVEITHGSFSQDYHFVRNSMVSISVFHEGGSGPFTYSYLPMQIKPLGSGTDLDQGVQIQLGDVGQIIAQEIDNIDAANLMTTRPSVRYRTYKSNDLSTPLFGPIQMELRTVTSTKEGSILQCVAPYLNITRTGILYTAERFPMLRAFFKN